MKRTVILLGKLPPPIMGTAISTSILLNSKLNNFFDIVHVDTKTTEIISGFGGVSIKKICRVFISYWKCHVAASSKKAIVVIPVSQSTYGFIKDSFYILISYWDKCIPVVIIHGSEFGLWYKSARGLKKYYCALVMSAVKYGMVLSPRLFSVLDGVVSRDCIYAVRNGGNYNVQKKNDSAVFRIASIASLHPRKGIIDVVKALNILENDNYYFQYEYAGGEADDQYAKDVHREACLLKKPAKYHGQVNERERSLLLGSVDVFVFVPTQREGLPWVVIEAAAAGLPIIATSQGAIEDVVVHGYNGFIVPPSSPKIIADRIRELYDDRSQLVRMSENSIAIYKNGFTEDAMVESYKHALNAIIARENI